MTSELSYERVVDTLRELVAETIPGGGSILIVSRGDGRLLDVPGRQAGHFPQTPHGMYAGHHPADGAEAVRQLVSLRTTGAGYLVFPETARWWLTHYRELREWLAQHGRMLADRPATGIVFALDRRAPAVDDAASTVAPHVAALAALLPPDVPLVVIGPTGAGSAVTGRPVSELTANAGPIPPGPGYAVVIPPTDPSRLPAGRRLICHRHALDLYALDD
jgi:hypothetical protein